MRLKRFDFDLEAIDAEDGLAAAQAVAGAAALTLNGALIVGGTFTSLDGMGRKLDIVSAGDDSGITFTVVGTDSDGKALTEIVTGGDTTTVNTTKFFLTVTSITTSGAAAGNVSVGTVDEACSKTIPIGYISSSGCSVAIKVTGTINFTVRETFEAFQRMLNVQSVDWFGAPGLSAKTADTVGETTVGASGIQFVVNSYSTGAEVQMHLSQPIRS